MRCPQTFGSSVTVEKSVVSSEAENQCVDFYAGDFTDNLDEEVSRVRKPTRAAESVQCPTGA